MTCGIYMIKNKKTGQMYIGQSIDIERRWKEHCNGYAKEYSYIDRAIQKDNNNFEIIILEELLNNIDTLNKREKYWIKYYNTYINKKHYNLTPGGDFNPSRVPEVAKKISKSVSGEKNPFYGKKHTKESREKISKNHKDISGENNPNYGKKISNEVRKKMSLSRNISGYYRVNKTKCKRCKEGFIWRYQYTDDNGKKRVIKSVDINKLEQKVKAKKLLWYKFEVN